MQSDGSSYGSVTQWIEDLRNDVPDSFNKIWNRFVGQLVSVAEAKLRNTSCRITDGNLVASQAFTDFYERGPDGFEKLIDRNDLWQILCVITERRAIDAIRSETCERRGGGRIIGESDFAGEDDNSTGLNRVPDSSDPPDIQLMLVETLDERLGMLDDELLCEIAIDRMNNLSNQEIADKHGLKLRTVERKVKAIREAFKQEPPDDSGK
ncbi:MAG: ECF-type sigma factor [Planctomycetota bacterium]